MFFSIVIPVYFFSLRNSMCKPMSRKMYMRDQWSAELVTLRQYHTSAKLHDTGEFLVLAACLKTCPQKLRNLDVNLSNRKFKKGVSSRLLAATYKNSPSLELK